MWQPSRGGLTPDAEKRDPSPGTFPVDQERPGKYKVKEVPRHNYLFTCCYTRLHRRAVECLRFTYAGIRGEEGQENPLQTLADGELCSPVPGGAAELPARAKNAGHCALPLGSFTAHQRNHLFPRERRGQLECLAVSCR